MIRSTRMSTLRDTVNELKINFFFLELVTLESQRTATIVCGWLVENAKKITAPLLPLPPPNTRQRFELRSAYAGEKRSRPKRDLITQRLIPNFDGN